MTSLDAIIEQRNLPGILIFNLHGSLLFMNKEAESVVPILRHSVGPGEMGKPCVPEAILELLEKLKRDDSAPSLDTKSASSYRMLYSESGVHLSLRAFFVSSADGGQGPSQVMVLVEKVIEQHKINMEKARKKFSLSKRETEVLKHICMGLSNKDISEMLFISEYTVKDHIKKIMKTMSVTSRSEIIASLVMNEG